MNLNAAYKRKFLAVILPCLILAVALMIPFAVSTAAYAQGDSSSASAPSSSSDSEFGKVVRVGWYESSFNTIDKYGRRSGYGYEYQLKIAAYTGWTYKYVEGSWSDLMQMLEKGEIDMMSDISYTTEREEHMLFPSLPMGTEEYYLFIAPGNQEILSTDYSTLNGKKIAVNKDSIQADFLKEWVEREGVKAQIVEVTSTEDESLRKLENGELDAYVTVDYFTDQNRAVPVCKIGSSDFFFAIAKNRPDLLDELNVAMSKIQDENRYYNEQMLDKHVKRVGANAFLASDEADWLSKHGTIRVGYQDNYLAFCASDKTTGEPIGAIKDYLAYASDCIANVHLDFEAKPYSTLSSAIDALKQGEVDCVFPTSLSVYDSEKLGIKMTPAMMNTDIYAVVRQSDQGIFSKKEHVVVAVGEGNPNYDAFLMDRFPDWRKVYFQDTERCLKAVADNVADCVLISSYRYNNLARLCKQYRLTTLATGFGADYSLAVDSGAMELYSILSKVVNLVPASTANAALTYYSAEDSKLTFADFLAENMVTVIAIVAAVLLLILALLIRSMRSERKARNLISATETDRLTGLYNRSFFFQYANRMYHEHPNTPMDAIVLNIERFHSVNALNGREFGDQVLRALGDEIRAVTKDIGGIAGRFEADRFDIYCPHTKDYRVILDRLQGKLDDLAPNASIRLRMGVMPWQANLEPVQLFDRARTACSMARGHYADHLIVFDEKILDREVFEQRLLNDLRQALDSFEFEVYYQPKFDIQSDQPKLAGAEALVRWRHPEFGIIVPEDFVPLLERNGQIGVIDKFVWAEVAKQIARWRELYRVSVPVSVNLSRVDVFDTELENTLDDILSKNGLSHDAIELEVTESAYTENADQVIQVVESLRKNGYEVGMDDFGTGYSSLNMLSAMPIDFLKMDIAFIRNIERDEKDVQLVALIIGIAENLGIPVVAEGVETEGQLKLLRDLGCPLVQGYYFAHPIHASEFESAYLQDTQPGQ